MISMLWTWFQENGVETGKGESWKLDNCKIDNLGHIFWKLYNGEF